MFDKPIIICGKTNSGKTTLALTMRLYGFRKIVQYTTRPMRSYEIQDIDYHFVSNDEFDDLIQRGIVCEEFTMADGVTYKWGALKEELIDGNVIAASPTFAKAVVDAGIDCYVVYLDVDDDSIIKKQIERGDELKEAERRLKADKKDFEWFLPYIDYIINNDCYKYSSNQIAKDMLTRIFETELENRRDFKYAN